MATFQIYKDGLDQFRWRLRAANGKIIADSGEAYVAKTDCQAGIELVKTQGPTADVEDHTDR